MSTTYETSLELPLAAEPKEDVVEDLIDIHASIAIIASLMGVPVPAEDDFTLTESNKFVLCRTESQVIEATLPPADSVVYGKEFDLKVSSSNNPVKLLTVNGELIDGLYTSYQFVFPKCVTVVTDNIGWWIR